jgi:hypothetical protein
MKHNRINLTERQEKGQWAIYLPAISGFITTQLGKALADPNFIPSERMPKGFENGADGLNFLDPDKGYYYYKWGLFSAGHAERRLDKCDLVEPMIHKRHKDSFILSDSGGFQIATGVIKLDWATVKGPEGDKLREEILRYLEHSSDYAMTLDVPAFAAVGNLSKKTGLTKFEDTLDITEHNLKYFVANRKPGATKFLNVLSGSTPENSKIWFDTVIPYSIPETIEAMGYDKDRTLEGGYAFAGINMKHMPSVLNRLLDLREVDALKDKSWIHFLGIGRLDWACYLTSIQRQLRLHDNPDITISFDAASAFVAVAYGLAYNYNSFDCKRLTYQMDKAIDVKEMKGSQLSMPFQSPIMDRLVVGDICVLGNSDPNKNGKIGKTSWDTFSYCLYMLHNLYNHIQAVQEINRLADIEHIRKKASYKDWMRSKSNSKSLELSLFVPSNILFFEDFVKVLFDPLTINPRQMIIDNMAFLESISFGGTSHETKSTDSLTNLFDMESLNIATINQDNLANSQNEETDQKLSELDNI